MPFCAGFSCRKQQNCELNLDSDERTWAGTADISQICSLLSFIVLLTSLDFGNGSLQASFGEHNLARSQFYFFFCWFHFSLSAYYNNWK